MTPYFERGPVRIYHGRSEDVLPALGTVGSIVTDPPYGLSFMGRAWDHGVPPADLWALALAALPKGGHLLASGGTRTFHRLACAIEDAGFDIRDCLNWLHGSGFPKGKGQLKPAWEPIILARKPGPAPWLNVDGCRLGGIVPSGKQGGRRPGSNFSDDAFRWPGILGESHPAGRWPANVCLDEEAAALLDAQSGERRTSGNVNPTRQNIGYRSAAGRVAQPINYRDTGGASRFFYCAKASRSERGEGNDHPTVKPLALMRWLVRLITPPGAAVLDPFMGSGSTLVAAHLEGHPAIGIDADEHACEIAARRLDQAVLPMEVTA